MERAGNPTPRLPDPSPPTATGFTTLRATCGNGAGTGTTLNIMRRLLRIHVVQQATRDLTCVYIVEAAGGLQATLAELPVASIHMALISRSDLEPLDMLIRCENNEANKRLQAIGAKARLQPEP